MIPLTLLILCYFLGLIIISLINITEALDGSKEKFDFEKEKGLYFEEVQKDYRDYKNRLKVTYERNYNYLRKTVVRKLNYEKKREFVLTDIRVRRHFRNTLTSLRNEINQLNNK
jgi:hypothetical protein